MCSNGHINSIEVAVLCLLQKIMKDLRMELKRMTREIPARANTFKSSPLKLVLYYNGLQSYIPIHTQHSGAHKPTPPRQQKLQNINYYIIK